MKGDVILFLPLGFPTQIVKETKVILYFHAFVIDCGHAGGMGATSGPSPPTKHKKQEMYDLLFKLVLAETYTVIRYPL